VTGWHEDLEGQKKIEISNTSFKDARLTFVLTFPLTHTMGAMPWWWTKWAVRMGESTELRGCVHYSRMPVKFVTPEGLSDVHVKNMSVPFPSQRTRIIFLVST
jgi:hypothetical protein